MTVLMTSVRFHSSAMMEDPAATAITTLVALGAFAALLVVGWVLGVF